MKTLLFTNLILILSAGLPALTQASLFPQTPSIPRNTSVNIGAWPFPAVDGSVAALEPFQVRGSMDARGFHCPLPNYALCPNPHYCCPVGQICCDNGANGCAPAGGICCSMGSGGCAPGLACCEYGCAPVGSQCCVTGGM